MRKAAGPSNSTHSPGKRIFPENDETAFRLQAAGSKVTGHASLRVELDTGGSAFRPVSQRICGHG
jgi:hypothetical protein